MMLMIKVLEREQFVATKLTQPLMLIHPVTHESGILSDGGAIVATQWYWPVLLVSDEETIL